MLSKRSGYIMKTPRYIVLTDILDGFEVDDIQSMIRLMLYSNEIDIEALISCTSCFVKGNVSGRVGLIHRIIDAYGETLPNLRAHASGWRSADYYHSITYAGIDEYGLMPGFGFASMKYRSSAGVKALMECILREDPRPLYIGLWGGANTLAQAVWQIGKLMPDKFSTALGKLRIYGISDQDHASRWLRKKYGDRLFWIVSPSRGSWFGNYTYWKAAWPGISSDLAKHGSEDGVHKTLGFSGGRSDLVSDDWIDTNIRSKGALGALYPHPKYIVEGDTPSFLWIIPNGLNVPERPDYGGWGGRYEYYRPEKAQFGVTERHSIWTNASDTVFGSDGRMHTSPQATIWRWREAFQNDFAARMLWTSSPDPAIASCRPEIKGEIRDWRLNVWADGCDLLFYPYPEAGSFTGKCQISPDKKIIIFGGHSGETLHIIAEARTKSAPFLTSYRRFIITL